MNANAESSGLLRKAEAAKYLNVGLRTFDGYLQRRLVPFFKLGSSRNSSVRFKKEDLDVVLEKFRVEATEGR